MNIFVTKLDFGTKEEELKEAFSKFGEVTSAKIIVDKFTGRSKGYGFVEMPNDGEANNAINKMNETELKGRKIIVKKSEPRENEGGGFSRNSNKR